MILTSLQKQCRPHRQTGTQAHAHTDKHTYTRTCTHARRQREKERETWCRNSKGHVRFGAASSPTLWVSSSHSAAQRQFSGFNCRCVSFFDCSLQLEAAGVVQPTQLGNLLPPALPPVAHPAFLAGRVRNDTALAQRSPPILLLVVVARTTRQPLPPTPTNNPPPHPPYRRGLSTR